MVRPVAVLERLRCWAAHRPAWLPATALVLLLPAIAPAQDHPRWINYTNGDNVRGLGGAGGRIWVATNGGVVAVDEATGARTFYTRTNSALTRNDVSSAHVTADGHVWVGMQGGVGRFDGAGWTVYPSDDPIWPFAPSGLLADNRGDLWIYGATWWAPPLLAKREGETWRVVASDSAAAGRRVTGVVVDERGDLWLSVYPWHHLNYFIGGGLARRSGGTWTTFTPANSGLASYFLTALALDRDGALWAGSQTRVDFDPSRIGGVARFDGSTWTQYDRTNSELTSEYVNSIVIDREGVKWVGTYQGLFRFDGTAWTRFDTGNSGLPSNAVTRLFLDADDDLWVGTLNAGLARFDGTEWTTYDTSNSPLPYDPYFTQAPVSVIERDPSGRLWIGLRGGSSRIGLIRVAGDDWTLYDDLPFEDANDDVYAIAFDPDGKVWVAASFGLAVLDGDEWTVHDSTNSPLRAPPASLVVDSVGAVWVSADRGVLARFHGDTWTLYTPANSGLPDGWIWALAVDHEGRLLVAVAGNEGGILVRFDGETWSEIPVPSGALLRPMVVDEAGNAWAGAYGSGYLGLARFDGAAWTIYDTSNSGMPTNYVESLAIDGSDIWIGTCGGGVVHFDGTHWDAFDTANSGIADDYCIPSIGVAADGRIWIGHGDAGLSVYSPVTTAVEVEALEAWDTGAGVLLTWRLAGSALGDLLGVGVQRAVEESGPYGLLGAGTLLPAATMEFVDSEVLEGTCWYRLALHERSGREICTPAIQVAMGAGAAGSTTLEAPSVARAGQAVTIRYRTPRAGSIELALYDVHGRRIRRLVHGSRAAGNHSIAWTPSPRELARGVYLLHLDAGAVQLVRKLVLLKP